MSGIIEPTLLLDESRCRNNIRHMADKVAGSGARFRPHFKTHQSLEIGEWFRQHGVDAITVSSVRMAEYFSTRWNDITIAIPFNIHEVERVNEIGTDCTINLVVMDPETTRRLAGRLRREVGVYIKIDVGYGRTGLLEDDPELENTINTLAASPNMTFKGFLGHAGHTYHAGSRNEIGDIDQRARVLMKRIKNRFQPGFPGLETSLGDTPGCSVADDLSGVSEWRPGNFVFYDLTQYRIGSCELDDIAVAMACPVIARHPDRLIIHGGGVHFARDMLPGDDGNPEYGWVVEAANDGWGEPVEGLKLTSLSQEHGTLTGPTSALAHYTVGDIVLILPVHSCMTANTMKRYRTLTGEFITNIEAG